ncbi:serine protease nudel [Hylaeus anthracinus]|uniref:serine protease nudel n=1 Tax=Hylaeus anthracinus TaxID=313031 RepID=UPI0023BA26F7|nr:serine protease nudel [Hylaeus anthracinus]
MDTACSISFQKLENEPIIDGQYSRNRVTSKIDNPTPDTKCGNKVGVRNPWNFFKHHRFIFLVEVLAAILILFLAASMLYLTIVPGGFYRVAQADQLDQSQQSSIDNSLQESQDQDMDRETMDKLISTIQLLSNRPEWGSLLYQVDQNRQKRYAGTSACTQNRERCKAVIDSMKAIANLVDDSMPHLQALLNSFMANPEESKSEFMELVNCLQCKNDSITFIDHSGPGSIINNNRIIYENPDHLQIGNNVDVVANLLDEDRPSDGIYFNEIPSDQFAPPPDAEIVTMGTFDRQEDSKTTKGSETTERESATTETRMINATASASATSKAQEAANQTNRIDDMEQKKVAANVPPGSDRDNVTEIGNDAAQPSYQGQAGRNGTKEESQNDSKNPSRMSSRENLKSRIVSNDRFQTKGNPDFSQGVIPTAETMKSTQQLQLTPTMSWMPHQVCFYGPAANGAAAKQSAPGQVLYPSAPGSPYPMSMPQPRGGFQNPTSQVPNFMQVHAQTVQFMQPYPNTGLSAGQRGGPTAPATQNLPMFPGHQTSATADTSQSAKPPYYCTYIPVPTFQFPAIPGVSEYQRSGALAEQGTLAHASYGACPPNAIRCRDGGGCILRSQWCDGHVNCGDASDEITCSCRDRISEERLCDGYFDCPHGEDELGCLGCPKTSFSCNDVQQRSPDGNCVPLSQRCDGVKQCANGKDEMDCNILTPTYIEGKNVFTIGYTEGYLHKNYMGQWYPVSEAAVSWVRDACISEIGQEMERKPEVEIHSIPSNTYQGPSISAVGDEVKLTPSSTNTTVYVRCPPLVCGTRVLTPRDQLQPQLPEADDGSIMQRFFRGSLETEKRENNTADQDDIVGSQMRVVGGRASHPKAWPFLVAIYKDGSFYCGGVILNEMWVLTAAHCLNMYMGHYFEVEAGLLRRLSFSPMAQSRKARYTIVHPRYNSEDMRNDIGMIMLDEPLRFNRWVRPVCLPEADILGAMWRFKPEPGSICVAIGWGATKEHGLDSDHLREVEVPILKSCKYAVDRNDATICAGYPQGGRDACQGDSGGPLMCKNPYAKSHWYVAGIVSHGEGCGRPNEPGTYTKVSYHLEWIREVSSGQSVPPLRRTPLEKCPGFSCEGGLGRCLPLQSRCNRIVECLDGEDELYCPGNLDYVLYRQSEDPNSLPSEPDLVAPEVEDTTAFEVSSSESIELRDDDDSTSTTYNPEDSRTPAFPTTFACGRLLQSIPIQKRCDRVADCEDSTDEINCTCKEYLTNLKPTAICDGYVDCDDKTDEKGCKICSDDEFFCRTSRTCIPLAKKCDGQFDCEHSEDELDCFTLSNGRYVYLDADERPFLNMQGILTRYVNGKWRTTCHRPRIHQNRSTVTLIGQNMCEYFGFANLKSSESVTVNDSKLETIPWEETYVPFRETSSIASANDKDETCPGLYIRCRPVLGSSVFTHLTVDTETGSRNYQWPWLAAIFVDGGYRCSATLLDRDWLLSPATCVENVRLDVNYTTALLGYGPQFRYVDGPHQQVSIIDEIQLVNRSESVLLHLNHHANFTRHVRPLFPERTVHLPGLSDTCVAVGTDENYETSSVLLKTVLQDCQSCHRCFVNTSISECLTNQTSEWSGMVFCRGKKGWYPAATFQDKNGPCSFHDTQSLLGMDHINPYLLKALDGTRLLLEASCDGFRCDIGECIPHDRVCDGVPDCRDQADEDPKHCREVRENCENSVDGCSCTKSELRCHNGRCVDKGAFCDGRNDCYDDSDEPTVCTCAEYLKLTAPGRLCDGVRHCLDKTDESPEMCPCSGSGFKCATTSGNDTCIPRDFICDGEMDCMDGEDEATCRMIRQFSNDTDGSGEVIRRSYGVWHSECFPNPISEEEASNLCTTIGYTSGNIDNDTTVAEEPMIPIRDRFYVVKMNDWLWMALRNDKPLVTLVKPDENCHRAFVSCV